MQLGILFMSKDFDAYFVLATGQLSGDDMNFIKEMAVEFAKIQSELNSTT